MAVERKEHQLRVMQIVPSHEAQILSFSGLLGSSWAVLLLRDAAHRARDNITFNASS